MQSDLRTFLGQIPDILTRIKKQVRLDILSALIAQADHPILFENIKGFRGWSICDLLLRDRKCQARVLKTTPDRVLHELYRTLMMPAKKPAMVNDGPVKEKIFVGAKADLHKLPAFTHAEHDAGPVITAMTFCRDPDSGNANVAFTRVTPRSRAHAGLLFITPHMQIIHSKYEALGKRMPFACVVGVHPTYEIAGSYSLMTHLERFGEMELVENLLGEPIEMVRCETIDLEVPANAEVVIEGYVPPKVREDEGPGPSPAVYYYPGVTKQPVFNMTAITMRESPIFRQHDTILYTDHQPLPRLCHEAILFERLREQGIKVHDVRFVPWGGVLSAVIKVTPQYEGQVRDALLLVMGAPWVNTKMAVAVDDDINLDDPADLYWSLATRVDPEKDVTIVPQTRGNPMDPSAHPLLGSPGRATVGKWGIDATKPPANRLEERKKFQRCWPPHWGRIKLQDYIK